MDWSKLFYGQIFYPEENYDKKKIKLSGLQNYSELKKRNKKTN